jgi:methylmalonyl-CoA mutase
MNDLVQQSDFPTGDKLTDEVAQLASKNPTAIARIISAENFLILKASFRGDSQNEENCKTPSGDYRNRWFRKIIS